MRRGNFLSRTARGLCLTLALSACGLLDTDQPNIIDPESLDTPEGAEARYLGALADFAFARDGDGEQITTDGQVLLSGLMSDEFVLSTTPPSQQEVDQLETFEINPTIFGLYHNLHRARRALEDAADALENFSLDGPDHPGIPEALALAGFTYVYFAENFCSGVPYSSLDEDRIIFGDPQTTQQTLDLAVSRFDDALGRPGIAPEVMYLASVGRARALLFQGQFAAAAQAVQAVPTDWQYVTEHAQSPLRLQNAVWSYSTGFLWSVAEMEGGAGLPYRSAADPRVPYIDEGTTGLDNTTPQFTLTKYADAGASITVADGIEARLIEAEAQLQAGDSVAMTVILNDLRANAISPALPMLADPQSRAEAEDLLFHERAFWLFATGHRHGDMRRLLRPPYSRAANAVFPTGNYIKGGAYGTDVNLNIPVEERNNPNFSGCIDRNP